ncbi:PHD finger protein 7-like [Aquila chrysaetos chrysaetos]|uniref:PHD finger protein 7-like n=1 Tax=Aquila chrysaetos chrysaetos TaxID=223781 RepID=UPI001B7D423D|nr:PHD finger protein 7-like [Aquila chrysaetos chrysaetos]
MVQPPPAQCPAELQEEQAGPSCAPSPPAKKRQVPEEEGECRTSPQAPASADFGRCLAMKAVAPTLWEACRLCRRAHCDPEVVGQLCCQDGLCVHENCLYHASGLSQRGADEEGFYGFLLPDIWQELERVAQKRCCICRLRGASVTCQRRRCPRSFHFPCGRERGCVSQFFGEFKSFCWKHRPVQRVRAVQQEQTACLVCREVVARRPRYDTLVCPTCASAWFHRCCIQGQALRSALHHFRCPLCQDVDAFQEEMFRLGIKIPDRDAAWEEDGSFADHHVRHSSCDASQCLCPVGREEAEEKGPWRLLLCSSCGSCGTHQLCSAVGEDTDSWECGDCSDTGTVPPIAAVADSSPPAQGPSHSAPAPGTLAEEKEAGILEGHPDSQLPSEPMSNKRADLP